MKEKWYSKYDILVGGPKFTKVSRLLSLEVSGYSRVPKFRDAP